MRLRAKIRKEPGSFCAWVVELWTTGPSGVSMLFGTSEFLSWEHALHWAIWRVTPRELSPLTLNWRAGG